MKCLFSRGQSSFELIGIVSVLFLMLIGAFALIQVRTGEAYIDRNNVLISGVGNLIRSEFYLASAVNADYYREFTLPQFVDGVNYSIRVDPPTDVVLSMDGIDYLVFLSENFVGNLTRGDNVIRKINGTIYVNVDV